MKTAARRNIKKIMDDVDEAKKKYQTEIECGNMAERYWKQVKMARENLNEELQILFPNINIHEKKITLDENTFDLFVLHMYNKVSNLQRELEKTRVNIITKFILNIQVFINLKFVFHYRRLTKVESEQH